MSNFIAVLDREHLENKLFLTSFAKSLASINGSKGIVIHGDSEYTERLIQTGMMRKDARERAVKDLNRRLVGLFADQGVPAVGVHGYQKNLVSRDEDGTLNLQEEEIHQLPDVPCLLISSLVQISGNNETEYSGLDEFAALFHHSLQNYRVVLFSKNEQDEILISGENKSLAWEEMDKKMMEETIPEEFRQFREPAILASATDFGNWPALKNMTELS